jgi:DNA-directed RNA polymerase subunit beta'
MTDYFISTYGARKGLVDTALRTADSGYLTRRLVDVAQDSIINLVDCGSSAGMLVTPLRERRTGSNQLVDEIVVPIKTRVYGRKLATDVRDPQTGEVVVKAGTYADKAIGNKISELEQVISVDKLTEEMMTAEVVFNAETKQVIAGPDIQVTEALINEIKAAGFEKIKVYPRIWVRSAVGCIARDGICQSCYGYDLSTNKPVDIGVAVGVVAAQSIGEPGTQLTMRTFHLGGAIVTQKTGVKAKADGVISFDEMNWQMKVARGKHAMDAATDEADKDSDFERNVRRISLSGDLIIRKKTGSLERYTLPVGATLKVKDGAQVRAGDWLAEYNPNEIITGASGTVHFEDILVKDGQVVGRDGKVSIQEKGKVVGEYLIPLRGQLKVEEGDAIVAGDVICEVATEDKSAIAGIDGEIEFSNIKIKNQRVISDNGMLYIVPKGDKAEESDITMPSGMKHYGDTAGVQELPLGPMLRVKNGDQVREGDQLAAIFSEYDGEIEVQGTKTLLVHSQALREHYMTGNMEIEIDEDEKKLTFVSELAGKAKIISYRSSSNKTVDRRRVIIKDERVYVIPTGAQLSYDNVDVEAGDLVEAGQKITGPIPFVSDLDGSVEVTSRILGELVNLTTGTVGASDLQGRVLNESILISKTGEIIGLKGEVICEDLATTILAEADDIGKISIEQLSETKCIVVTHEDGDKKEYLVPPGATLVVETGDEIKIGEQLIESFAPIEVETGGKINYITEYNKMTGEDLIRKIVVYSGRDYFFPVGIPLVVKNGQFVEQGEAITEEVPFETFEKVDRGIKFTSMEEVVKKYHINTSMVVNVTDGDQVKIGSQLATINSDRPGVVKVIRALTKTGKIRSVVDRIVVQSGEAHHVVDGAELMCKEGDSVKEGDILAKWGGVGQKTTDIIQGLPRVSELFEIRKPKNESLIAALSGKVSIRGNSITITSEEAGGKQFKAQYGLGTLLVQDGEMVEPGVRMTDGNVDPRKLAKLAGVEKVQRYLIDEVQQVYRSQGVNIDDRHIEVIVSNMMTKVQIVKGGDTVFLPGAIVNKFSFLDENARVRVEEGRIAEGIPVLQGITKASLTTDSFISAASFQETTRVLTKAAIKSKVDELRGLKENIIIGKLIPAGTGMWSNRLQWKFSDDQPVQRELTEKEKEEQALLQTLTGDITPTGDGADVIDPDSVPAELNKSAADE